MMSNKKGFAPILIILFFALLFVVLVISIVGIKTKDEIKSKINNVKNVETLPSPSPISNDTSFSTIEAELDSTVVLEEDFSDL